MRTLTVARNDQRTEMVGDYFRWLVLLAAMVVAATTLAQDKSAGNKDELPALQAVQLTTKDQVGILAAYYPSRLDDGKAAIPVLIFHEWKGQASPYYELCIKLQEAGYAVLVPEYRGHGGSRDYVDRRGQTKKFNIVRMSKRDIENIILRDFETVKGFLKDKNNEGALNLNALVVIGIQEGAVLAAQWSQRDWKFPSVGRKKQGQDVKALIYVSPEKQIKGIGIDQTLNDRDLIQLPMMIVTGNGADESDDAMRMAKQVEGLKKRRAQGNATGFNLLIPNTSLSGHRLINDVPEVSSSIIKFINNEIKISDQENEWIDRL